MFNESSFNQDISKWDLNNVEYMSDMFHDSPFSYDLSSWHPINAQYSHGMFDNCPAPIPYWYTEDAKNIPHLIRSKLLVDRLHQTIPQHTSSQHQLKI